MKNTIILATIAFGMLAYSVTARAQIGTMPIPSVDTAEIDVTVEIVPSAGGEPTNYIYRYTVTNPATSTDGYYRFSIDVSEDIGDFDFARPKLLPTLTTLPKQGGATTRPFLDEVDVLQPFPEGYEGQGVIAIGLECPPGWNGSLRRNATVACFTANGTPTIAPGETLSGFAVHSRFPPMLREVDSTAFWTVVVDDLEADIGLVDRAAAFQVLEDLRRPQILIGPGYRLPSLREHYILFARDLADMKTLGWIPNATLAEEITTIVEDAGNLFRTGQGTAAKLRLDDLVTAVNAAPDADIIPVAGSFLLTSVDSIQEFGRNTFPSGGLNLNLRFAPGAPILRVGETYDLEVFAFRLNNDDFRSGIVEEADLNAIVYFGCDDDAPVDPGVDPCPNVPLAGNPSPSNRTPVPVDANGVARFSFVGTKPGRDHIELCIDQFCEGVLGRPIVDWIDPPDLVIQAFSPELILAESGESIVFTDITANIGDGASGASTTAYFISDSEQFDINTAVFVGERDIPALAPGELNQQVLEQFELPPGFAMGEHYLFACADSEDVVAEEDELNNCSDSQVRGSAFFSLPVADYEDIFVVTSNDVTVPEGDSGSTEAIVEFELSQLDPNADISFGYLIIDGTASVADNDYTGTDGTITFPAGSGGPVTEQLSVTINGDSNVEDDETITIEITPLSGDAVYRPLLATITIQNDDDIAPVPNIRIDGGSIVEGDEGVQALDVTVSIDQADPTSDVSVQVSTVELTATAATDYEMTQVTVVFPSGTTQLSQTVPINVFGDFIVEDDETFQVELSNASANAAISVGTAIGTIEDDDFVAVTIGDVSEFEGDSGLTGFDFNVSIDQADPSGEVIVNLQTIGGSAQAGSDYNEILRQLTFPANTTTLSQIVTVSVVGDEDVEPDEEFSLVANSVSANAVILEGEGLARILNDDIPPSLDCSTATASPNALWPPNHKLVTIEIAGVFGPDGTAANITVTGITQDESVNGEGDGDTSPDGFGVGTDSPQVRRERSGLGDGRVYFIDFEASDNTSSATCSGQVAIGVPHDQGQGATPIDSGFRFDSTVP